MVVIISSITANAQTVTNAEVPAVVKTKFASLYPNVKVEKWKKEKENYKAEFDENKTEMCVIIDAKGDLVKTKSKIEASELPASAKEYIEKNHAGKKITKACKMTDAKGDTHYKAEVGEMDLIFDANGTFVKEEKEKDMKKEEHKK